jgi:hypothetical protein
MSEVRSQKAVDRGRRAEDKTRDERSPVKFASLVFFEEFNGAGGDRKLECQGPEGERMRRLEGWKIRGRKSFALGIMLGQDGQLEMTIFPFMNLMSILSVNKSIMYSNSEGIEYAKIFSSSGALSPSTMAIKHSSCSTFRYRGPKISCCLFLTTCLHDL